MRKKYTLLQYFSLFEVQLEKQFITKQDSLLISALFRTQ